MSLEEKFEEILTYLRSIKKFPTKKPYKDKTRQHILNDGEDCISAFTLGKVRAYHTKIMMGSVHNKKHQKLLNLLDEAIKLYDPSFLYTTIQLNKNVLTPLHKDKNNVGLSLALSLGDFTGGGIRQFHLNGSSYKDIDTHNKFQLQDGSLYHKTLPFEGERYAFIFFFHKAGFNSPSPPPLDDILLNGMAKISLNDSKEPDVWVESITNT